MKYKEGDEIIVTHARGEKYSYGPTVFYWTGIFSRTGSPLLRSKDGGLFRADRTDPSQLLTGDTYH